MRRKVFNFTLGASLALCLVCGACGQLASRSDSGKPTNSIERRADVQPPAAPENQSADPGEQQQGKTPNRQTQLDTDYSAPVLLGALEDKAITESSGIVASRTNPGLYWTHNDSGGEARLYLFNQTGKSRGTWRVRGIRLKDWEDIAAGPGPQTGRPYLYLADIGDNQEQRAEIVVYRIPEPVAALTNSQSKQPNLEFTEPAEAIRLRYPDGAHDAETLLVHPASGELYIITKQALAAASVYKATPPLDLRKPITLQRIATIDSPSLFGGFFTGGDISPDGSRIALCDYLSAYEWIVPAPNSLDEVWSRPPNRIRIPAPSQTEAICYSLDGRELLFTSENAPAPLYHVVREK